MKNSSKSKVMVITGASSGIGRATALAWAKKGGNVVLAARSKEVLEEVAALCEDQGVRALVVQTDTTQEEQVNTLAAEAVAYFGKIDVWVNGAAVSIFGAFQKLPTDDIRRVLETNLFGYIHGARAATRQFCEQGWGTLINISSVTGIVGQAYSTPYSITKFGIRGLSDSLGQELANKKHIHVCTVMPSVIDTPIFQHSANYTGKAINPPVSAVPAQKVAEVILSLVKNPQKEVYVGKSTFLMRLTRFLSPTLFDHMQRKIIKTFEFKDEPTAQTSGNLYVPMPNQASISGGWLEKEREGKRKTLRSAAGKAAIAAGVVLGAGWLLKKSGE